MSNIEEFKEKWGKVRYIVDGIYIHFDGYQMILEVKRSENINWIAIEPEVFKNLVGYASGLDDDIQKLDSSYNRRFTDEIKKP